MVYYQINYYRIRYYIDIMARWKNIDSFTVGVMISFDSVTFLLSRLWCILPYLHRCPCWLLHQLQRWSEAGGPRPLCAISQQVLASPVLRPGRGMPSVPQILPQVFRSWQNSLPELQPETSPAQWVEFEISEVCMSWKALQASVTCLCGCVIMCVCQHRWHLCGGVPHRLLWGRVGAEMRTLPPFLSVLHWKTQPWVPRL